MEVVDNKELREKLGLKISNPGLENTLDIQTKYKLLTIARRSLRIYRMLFSRKFN